MRTPLLLALACVAPFASCRESPRDVVLDDGGVVSPGSYEDPFVQLQRLSTSTFIEILEVRAREDGMLLMCTAVRGLLVVDASNPAAMQTRWELGSSLGSSRFPRCQHLAYSGDIVYMTNRGDEVQPTPFVAAFDLSGDQPVEVATYTEADRTFEGIAAAGDYVYVAMHAAGIGVLERVGGALELRGTTDELTNAWGVAIDGDHLYVADGIGGLAVVDVSTPTAPAVVGRVALDGAAQHVELDAANRNAYVAVGNGGVAIVDVSDPTAPAVLATIDTPGTALQVALGGGHAYVADWNDVRVFDVSDPSAPLLVATERIDVSGFPRVLGIGARDDVAFIGEWTGMYSYRLFPERRAPDIFVGAREVDFGALDPGDVTAAAIAVANEGREPLAVWSIATSSSQFEADPEQLLLQPGQIAIVEVTFRPSSTSTTTATLTFKSDDPDESSRAITLAGNRPGAGVGDPAPEVALQLLEGGDWRLSEQRGNIVLLAYFATF